MIQRALRSDETGDPIAVVTVASGPVGRAIGLLLTSSLAPHEGMWFEPCAAIHTLGMRYAIDVVFLDDRGAVIETIPGVRPNRPSVTCLRARVTIELGEGTLERVRVERGDLLYLAETVALA